MRWLRQFLLTILVAASVPAFGQSLASPYSVALFKSQTFTATATTGAVIPLNGLTSGNSTVGSSFASATVMATGNSITTATFAIMGSPDNGVTFFPLLMTQQNVSGATPAPTATVTTATAIYQVSLAGMTHVQFVTSGTFTATSLSLTLSASPNAQVSKANTGGGGGSSVTLQTNGTNNGSQTLLNIVQGNGIQLTNSGGVLTIAQAALFSIASWSCDKANTVYEIGASVASPTTCGASYSGSASGASATDGSNTVTMTSPYTSAVFPYTYTRSTVGNISFTLSASSGSASSTSTVNMQFSERQFAGVGTTGATGATASGTTAVLTGATGTLNTQTFNSNGTIGSVTLSPSAQALYFLLTGGSHTFTVNGFPTTFTCTSISYTNSNGVSESNRFLCVSPSTLTGNYTIGVA